MHARLVARDRARPVADLGRRRDDPGARVPLRRAPAAPGEREREQRGGRDERRPAPQRIAEPVPQQRRREQPAAEHGDRRPGWRVQLDREPQARDALGGSEAHRRQLPDGQALRPEARGGRRHDEERGGEQRADGGERGDDGERDEHEQQRVRATPSAGRARAPSRRRTPSPASEGRAPALPAARPRWPRPPARDRACPSAAGFRTARSPRCRPSGRRRWRARRRRPAPPPARARSGCRSPRAAGARGARRRTRTRAPQRTLRAAPRSRGRRPARGRGRPPCRRRAHRTRGRACTIHVPSRPAAPESSTTSRTPRCTNSSWKGSSTELNLIDTHSHYKRDKGDGPGARAPRALLRTGWHASGAR